MTMQLYFNLFVILLSLEFFLNKVSTCSVIGIESRSRFLSLECFYLSNFYFELVCLRRRAVATKQLICGFFTKQLFNFQV